jgi:molybdate transport system substrate-binding protein
LRALSFILPSFGINDSGERRSFVGRSPQRAPDLSYGASYDQQETGGMMSQRQRTRYQRHIVYGVIPLVALFFAGVAASPRAADPVRVLAAVTLKPALDAVAAKYGDGKVVPVYGPSPMLAKQIEDGVPADIFFSADKIWMDELAEKRLINSDTNTDLVGNHLVLIARKGSGHQTAIAPGFPLAELVGAGPLAMCDPDSHPAGRYGKASLVALGVWPSVETKIARAENPLLAVKMVARGDAPFAIVFKTDAATDEGVEIVGTFPDNTHPRIVYPIAVLAQSHNPEAVRFLDFLKSPPATAIFREFGYVIPSARVDRGSG